MQPYQQRIQTLQKQLHSHQAILITQAADLTYFSGFRPVTANEREGFVLITADSAELFSAAFSPLPEYFDTSEPPKFLAVSRTTSVVRIAAKIFQAEIDTLFVDEAGIFLAESRQLEDQLRIAFQDTAQPPTLKALDHQLIWKQRTVKDETELTSLRLASQIARQAVNEILQHLQVGQTEIEIAHQLESRFRQLGAEAPAFPTIVAFGPHATLPHHQPGKTTLTPDCAVLIDCGAAVAGYNSDLTRTIWFGQKPIAEYLNVKEIVDRAYEIGLSALQKSSGSAKDVDEAVRSYIQEAGYGKEYIHTTGHGIGLEVHEPPSLYQTNPQPLQTNMVITVEPGIYVPGKFGYRYENTILLTSQGPEELTK